MKSAFQHLADDQWQLIYNLMAAKFPLEGLIYSFS